MSRYVHIHRLVHTHVFLIRQLRGPKRNNEHMPTCLVSAHAWFLTPGFSELNQCFWKKWLILGLSRH